MGETLLHILTGLLGLLGAITLLCKMCEMWWGQEGEAKLRHYAENFWVRTADALPESIVLKPLGVLTAFFDQLFGSGQFSRQALTRGAVVSGLMLVLTLSIVGLSCGKPMGMEHSPWAAYRIQQSFLKRIAQDPNFNKPETAVFHIQENAADLSGLAGTAWEIAYTVFFVAVVISTTALMNAVGLAISRLILREMLGAKAGFSVILMFVVNVVVVVAFLVMDSIVLFVALNVAIWPFVPLLLALAKIHIAAGGGGGILTSVAAWFFSGPWFKVVVMLSLFPSVVLGLVIGGCALGFPFRKAVKLAGTKFLERGLERKESLFGYIGMSAFLISAAIAAAAKLLS